MSRGGSWEVDTLRVSPGARAGGTMFAGSKRSVTMEFLNGIFGFVGGPNRQGWLFLIVGALFMLFSGAL
jgi:hypothetical protein